MSDEQTAELMTQLDELSNRIPVPPPPTDALVSSGRRAVARRRRRTVAFSIAAGLVVVSGATTAYALSADNLAPEIAALPAKASAGESSASPGPVVPTPGASTLPIPGEITDQQCLEPYSPAAVHDSPFAFDGVVTAIGPSRTQRDSAGPAIPLVAVTFAVKEWFSGGSASNVTVDMAPPPASGQPQDADGLLAYGVGSRLLVSGGPRWGGGPLDNAIAWGCGFTRPYDATVAAAWR